jgi:ABC-type transport system involved in multi-copper enzyme maturation permease subunit
MLSLYLASPLTRDTYLVAKTAAVLSILQAVTLGPPLLLLLAYTFEGAGPGSVGDFLTLLGRILLAGVTVALLWTSLSLAMSSVTSRKAFASAAIIVTLLASGIVVEILAGGDQNDLDLPNWIGSFDFLGLPFELTTRIYGEVSSEEVNSGGEQSDTGALAQMSTALVWGANLGWTVLFLGFTRWRYQHLDVDR